jgi:acyl dehydratase
MVAKGDTVGPWEAVADPERMKTMALVLHDPNPIHWDVDAVRRLGLGERPVNQGPNNMAYLVNALIGWTGDPRCVRSIRVRFLAPVHAGDRVVAGGSVTTVRPVDDGIEADCELWLEAGGRRVVTGDATVIIHPTEEHRRT